MLVDAGMGADIGVVCMYVVFCMYAATRLKPERCRLKESRMQAEG